MTTQQRPKPGTMYGLTHDHDGEPIIRLPRTLKVSIGQPAGKDCHVLISGNGNWIVTCGRDESRRPKYKAFQTRQEAEKAWKEAWAIAPDKKYPEKLPYFTFRSFNSDLELVPDFEAIEKHGASPTILPIVFTDVNPFDAAYQWWAAGRLNCYGDGLVGQRALTKASESQKALAEAAKAAGERFFPILDGCYTNGCPMSSPTQRNGKEVPAECKPNATLSFQLMSDMRLGAKAQFTTTGRRSVSHLFGSISELTAIVSGMTGRQDLRGIPLLLVLRPYFTNHNGQKAKAYSVSVELRPDSLSGMRKQIVGWAAEFQAALLKSGEPAVIQRQIAAAPTEAADEVPEPMQVSEEEAEALTAEFYPTGEDDDDTEPAPGATVADKAAEKTQETTAKIAEPKPTAETVKAKVAEAKPKVLPPPVDESGFF